MIPSTAATAMATRILMPIPVPGVLPARSLAGLDP
jgi:hypothetical protein